MTIKTIIMKKVFFSLLLLNGFVVANACSVCEKQQPEILKGITHGTGPQNDWDYLIVSVAAVIVVATLFFSIRWLLSPGEGGENHIKRIVLSCE